MPPTAYLLFAFSRRAASFSRSAARRAASFSFRRCLLAFSRSLRSFSRCFMRSRASFSFCLRCASRSLSCCLRCSAASWRRSAWVWAFSPCAIRALRSSSSRRFLRYSSVISFGFTSTVSMSTSGVAVVSIAGVSVVAVSEGRDSGRAVVSVGRGSSACCTALFLRRRTEVAACFLAAFSCFFRSASAALAAFSCFFFSALAALSCARSSFVFFFLTEAAG